MFMIGIKIRSEQILAIACPLCGALPEQKCEPRTGAQATPHEERVLAAGDKPLPRFPNRTRTAR
jgi:hypothetical protein